MSVSRAILVYMAAVLICFSPAQVLAKRGAMAVKTIAPLSQPFCKFTYVDHRGHSVRLSTNVTHASAKSLTFIFETGEKLIINFTIIRAGHFIAESARSKDPQILFYPSAGSHAVPMVGAVVISSTKPITGNFSHLLSDDDEHLTLVSGTFGM